MGGRASRREAATLSARRPGPLAKRALRAPARLYDRNLGWLLGHRFLRLTHQGRRSGRRYETVLEVLGPGRTADEFVVIAGLGPSANWYRNVLAGGAVEVAIARRRFPAAARTLDDDEAVTVIAGYERRNRWVAPVIRAVLSWLVGWRYDSTETARLRLVRELPLVAFRPAGSPPSQGTTSSR